MWDFWHDDGSEEKRAFPVHMDGGRDDKFQNYFLLTKQAGDPFFVWTSTIFTKALNFLGFQFALSSSDELVLGEERGENFADCLLVSIGDRRYTDRVLSLAGLNSEALRVRERPDLFFAPEREEPPPIIAHYKQVLVRVMASTTIPGTASPPEGQADFSQDFKEIKEFFQDFKTIGGENTVARKTKFLHTYAKKFEEQLPYFSAYDVMRLGLTAQDRMANKGAISSESWIDTTRLLDL